MSISRREFLAAMLAVPAVARGAIAALSVDPGLAIIGELPPGDQITRVLAAGNPASILAYALAPEKLLGWPMRLSDEARALLAPQWRDKPFLGRLAGRGSTLPVETLIGLRPHVIFDAGTVDAGYLGNAERVHAQTGIPFVVIDGRLADSARQLITGGVLLGAEARARQLAAYAADSFLACGTGGGAAAKVYLARGPDGLETVLPGGVNGEIIEAACGVNAVSASRFGSVANVSREQIVAWDPDLIVTQIPEFHALAKDSDFWRRLRAVRMGRLYLAPHLPFGWLDGPPGINRLVGLRWLHGRIRGEQPDRMRIAAAREFHQLFYGHAPDEALLAQMMSLA